MNTVLKWVLVPLTVLLSIKTTTSYANEIYMNQVGDNLTMTVVQDGKDNYFQYCAVNNDSNCTDVNGNAHNRADGVASDNAIVNSETIGDDNTVVVAHATGQNNSNINESNISVTGDRNKVQNFFSNHSSGSNQYSTQDWGGVKETNILIDGDDNTVKVASDSYGEVFSEIEVTGDDNSVILYQRSLNNTASIDVTNAGGPVSVNVQQLGSGYQDTRLNTASITNYCTNSNGCTVNMTQY
jgi:hypothetical protein